MFALKIDEAHFGCNRAQLLSSLKEKGIDTRPVFTPMHSQPLLKNFGIEDSHSYPITEDIAKTGFYLPSSSNLNLEKIQRIGKTIQDIHRELKH